MLTIKSSDEAASQRINETLSNLLLKGTEVSFATVEEYVRSVKQYTPEGAATEASSYRVESNEGEVLCIARSTPGTAQEHMATTLPLFALLIKRQVHNWL